MTDDEPTYFEVMVTHMLHRIWELQVAQAILLANDDDDRAYIQDIVDKQQSGEYVQPLKW